jgi:predicted MFS family arabinose efflux permease
VDRTEKANFQNLVFDIAWFGLAAAATSRFLSIFAIRLGADASDLGLISALPSLVLLISSALALWWLRHFRSPMTALQAPALGFRLVFLLPAFTPFLPPDFQIPWLIFSVTLPAIPQGIAGTVFLVLMRQCVRDDQITAITSRRQIGLNAGVAVGALGFGILLESLPFPLNYQLMFVLAFGFALMSQWHVRRMRAINVPAALPAALPPAQTAEPVKTEPMRRIWTLPGFRFVIFAVLITHLTFFSTVALVPLHLVRNLNASEAFVAAFGIVELLGGMLIATQTNRLSRLIGQRGLMSVGMIGTALALIVIALAPRPEFTLIAAGISGAAWTATAVGLFSYFLLHTPTALMAQGSIAYQQLAGLGMFIGPMVGSIMVDLGFTLVLVIAVGAGLRLLAGFALFDRSMLRLPSARRQQRLHEAHISQVRERL